jgi:hypothetical protein
MVSVAEALALSVIVRVIVCHPEERLPLSNLSALPITPSRLDLHK